VMLRNDVLQALQLRHVPKAQSAWLALQQAYPDDLVLASAHVLLEALQAHTLAVSGPALVDHAGLKQQRLALQERVAPVAQQLLGPAAAAHWLRPFWQNLVARAAGLPFAAGHETEHAVPILLHLQDWHGALEAVTRIESWRRIPAPLAWMAQAKLRLHGLRATWPLLAELAWLSPKRLEALVQTAGDVVLLRLKDQFDASFEPDEGVAVAPASGVATQQDQLPDQDMAWFPAWVLTQQPRHVADMAPAQPGQHSAPEQAMRLLVNLLGLEHQGRQHELIAGRKNLRELNGWLYAQYMKTR